MNELFWLRAQLRAAVRMGDREKAKALTRLCFSMLSTKVEKEKAPPK